MVKVFGVAGSLREGSYNAALLRAAARLLPDGTEIEIGTIAGPAEWASDDAMKLIKAAVKPAAAGS